jgi:exodeoxyribonuclease V beta subunit
LDQEEILRFDDLLTRMQQASKEKKFLDGVQEKYSAAIVDEFQDTDPVQWDIFQSLFLNDSMRLFLVGDPKQSIYAFRQADIYTYLAAVKAVGEDNQFTLNTNYRSSPLLVKALNTLFSQGTGEWMALPKWDRFLTYSPVDAGRSKAELDLQDGFGAVHFFMAEGSSEQKMECACFFPFIAQEIRKLNGLGCAFKQCAILVSDRYQMKRAQKFLEERGIPVSLQRAECLADSPAIPAFRELLLAVLAPRHSSALKIALGGILIGWTHQEILQLKENAIWEKTLLRFYHLNRILREKGIALFFQEFLNSVFMDEVSVYTALVTREGGVGLYSDLCHIVEILAEEESRCRATPEQAIALLEEWMQQADSDEGVKRRSDGDADSVQILTFHASKGLEFDVVFTLGLAKRTKHPQGIVSVGDRLWVPSANLDAADYEKICEEVDAEKMRQLYVALTRARERLYVAASFLQGKSVSLGGASPIELFLARLAKPGNWKSLYEHIGTSCEVRKLMDKLSDSSISYSWLDGRQMESSKVHVNECPVLIPPGAAIIPGNSEFMSSFSLLTKKKAHRTIHTQRDESAHKTRHTLPSNSQVGILFHAILEKIPFDKVGSMASYSELKPWIAPFISYSQFQEWEEVICQMVYDAIRTPLDGFSLTQVSVDQCYREMEFLYPWDSEELIPELERIPGFMKGVIDLIFRFEGRYYLIDWKSNWLGPKPEDYDHAKLREAMEDNYYLVQAKIYKEAFRKYLQIIEPQSFENVFGGIFYIFLRGLDGRSDRGVYAWK